MFKPSNIFADLYKAMLRLWILLLSSMFHVSFDHLLRKVSLLGSLLIVFILFLVYFPCTVLTSPLFWMWIRTHTYSLKTNKL